MHETISSFEANDGAIISDIEILGGGDKVTVILKQGSTSMRERVVSRHPGFWEVLSEQIFNIGHGPSGMSEQELFECRIRQTIEMFVPVAKGYVWEYEQQMQRVVSKEKSEEDRYTEVKEIAARLKGDFGPKKKEEKDGSH